MRKILLATITCFILQYSAAQSITLLFPDNGESLTDIGVAFKAKITSAGPYTLYLSKDQHFGSGVTIKEPLDVNGVTKDPNTNIVYWISQEGKAQPSKRFILTPGTWYWRVSDNGGSSFSETRSVIVNNAHSILPPERKIDPQHPIFHMRVRSQLFDKAQNPVDMLSKMVPEELKEYVVLDLGQSFPHLVNGRSLYDYSKLYNDAGYKFYFDLGTMVKIDRIASLAEMEKVFKELPNCVGAATSEAFYRLHVDAERTLIDGALILCRKYGKNFFYADMNWRWNKWQLFNYDRYFEFKQNQFEDYFLPLYKTTDPWGAYLNVSSIQGMKLSGMVKNIGIWTDMWCWEKFGQVNEFYLVDWLNQSHANDGGQKVFPYAQNIKQYIYGITYGSTVFGLEPNLQWSEQTGALNDNHGRYLIPFIKAVIDENLIPSEKVLNQNFNFIVDTELTSGVFGNSPDITYINGNIWGDFLRSTLGITDMSPYNQIISHKNVGQMYQSAYLEMMPNNDRYPSGIPFLPHPSLPQIELEDHPLTTIKISDLNTLQKVETKINHLYPPTGNEAYAQKIDSSVFVFNNYENSDISQKYGVGINYAGIDSLYGEIDLMSYVVARCRPDGETVFFQANAYVQTNINGGKYELPTYPTVLNIECQIQPTINSDEMSAISTSWDATNGILRVEIDHSVAGAVNFTLTGDADLTPDPIDYNPPKTQLAISSASDAIKVYPNPTADHLFVSKNIGSYHYKLYNLMGNEMLSGASDTNDMIDVNSLPSGYYVIMIETPSGKLLHRQTIGVQH